MLEKADRLFMALSRFCVSHNIHPCCEEALDKIDCGDEGLEKATSQYIRPANDDSLITMKLDNDLLAAALVGLEARKARLEEQIAAIKALSTGGKKVGRPRKALTAAADDDWEAPAVATPKTKRKTKRSGKRKLSPEARQRIAEAQKKRWATARGEA